MKKNFSKAKNLAKIPPPPDLAEGYEAIIKYHKKYTIDELVEAGHLEEASVEERREVQTAAIFQFLCASGLHIKLTRRECQQLAELAASKNADVESLAKGWVKEHLACVTLPGGNGAMG
jgi:hypothetical protein